MKNQQPFKFIGRDGRLFAAVRLHDIESGVKRDVSHESQCVNDLELSAYRECVSSGEVITMGKTIAEPLK